MPTLVQEIVLNHLDDLTAKDLAVIANDERFQTDMELWGDECDKKDWEKFYRSLREQMKERASDAETDNNVCDMRLSYSDHSDV